MDTTVWKPLVVLFAAMNTSDSSGYFPYYGVPVSEVSPYIRLIRASKRAIKRLNAEVDERAEERDEKRGVSLQSA
uniref:Uncharacterized protein n=1 Tax=Oryza nivara TaxID=4536 RepID=A0A0E0ISA6_ORYNI